ncbi:MAG TPA: hypothetical protein P5026_01550 [Kiritimatiellia bacterium]|nr:hypothetical protein [Kiritimatiellia bacterium]HRU69796.1 hypothetical protein [Kiritimatiellia bacterium]
MSAENLARYFELRMKQMEIERQLEELKPVVAASLRQRQGVALFDGYELRLETYTAWDYSPQVTAMQQALTDAKKRERADGTATVRERRDMLVLRSRRQDAGVHEDPVPYGEWELEK